MATDLRQRNRTRIDARPLRPSATLKVGLLGCGTVGSEVARALSGERWTRSLSLVQVAVADPTKRRPVNLDPPLLTTDAVSIVKDPEVDLVIELIGGIELPSILIRQALVEGKSVITANKEVVAHHGQEFAALAGERGVGFYFEGAVGGGVPMVAAITDALVGDRVLRFSGVLNGTTNYVLTTVSKTGVSTADAIHAAQEKGYAESDPSDDLDGSDAARKAAILASLAFGTSVSPRDVFKQGIEELSLEDVAAAGRVGFETKLIVTAQEYSGFLNVGVEPQAIPASEPLGRVDGSTNTLIVDCELAGRLVFTGPGAGGRETASAVLGDVRRALSESPGPQFSKNDGAPRVLSRKDVPGRFVVRCVSTDNNVAGRIQGCLFSIGVGTEDVHISEIGSIKEVVVVTGIGERGCIQRALKGLEREGIHCMSLLKIFDDSPRRDRSI